MDDSRVLGLFERMELQIANIAVDCTKLRFQMVELSKEVAALRDRAHEHKEVR